MLEKIFDRSVGARSLEPERDIRDVTNFPVSGTSALHTTASFNSVKLYLNCD